MITNVVMVDLTLQNKAYSYSAEGGGQDMMVTAWIILVFFGLFALWTSIQYYYSKRTLGWLHTLMWFLSAVITALSAGIIWGGLLSSVG